MILKGKGITVSSCEYIIHAVSVYRLVNEGAACIAWHLLT